MRLVSSAEEEVEGIRKYAALFDDSPSSAGDSVLEILKTSSSVIASAKADFDRQAAARGQRHLDGAHIELLWAWDAVAAAATKTKPPVPADKIRMPLITVSPIGRFDALSIRDVAGNTALVFDASLIEALFIIALHCGRAFFDWVQSYVDGDMDRFALGVVDLNGTFELHEILSSIVADGFVASKVIVDCVRRLDDRSWALGRTLYERAIQFLVGHEMAHFLYDHHLFDATNAEQRTSPLFALLRESLDRRSAHYDDLLVEPGEEQIRNFLFDQFQEFQADEQSMVFLAASGAYDNKHSDKRRLFVIDMAAAAICFMLSAAVERMAFIRVRGRDPAASPLYFDYGVMNLCLRTSHPSPISRLGWIEEWINANHFRGDEAAHFFCGPVASYFDGAIALDRGMRKFFRVRPQSVAKKWASRHAVDGLLSVLWPGADRPNLGDWLLQLDDQQGRPPKNT